LHIIETIVPVPNKFCTVTKTTRYSMGGPNTRITNPRWRMAAIFKSWQNRHISADRSARKLLGDAYWPFTAQRYGSTVYAVVVSVRLSVRHKPALY